MVMELERLATDTPQSVQQQFLDAVIKGLSQPQKALPCRYLYDDIGSQLFEKICEVDAYYVTRTEQRLLEDSISAIADNIGENAHIIEPGSGAGTKIRMLLRALRRPLAYTPVDISEDILERSSHALKQEFPYMAINPIAGDFDDVFANRTLFKHPNTDKNIIFFPGSTISNFEPLAALQFLRKLYQCAGPQGGLVIGVDLIKDRNVLLNAYDDPQGVTAAFNKNLLSRINRELDGDFDITRFDHRAIYNELQNRIEMHLVSNCHQQVSVGEHSFGFKKGEYIHTENSHKYTLDSFAALAQSVGFTLQNSWLDQKRWFATCYFSA